MMMLLNNKGDGSMIQTNELSKRYDNGFTAVQNMSIHVHKGDIYGFLGPNGAGKTTTIRMISGLIEPTSGSVFVDGMDVRKQVDDIRRIIGVLPESHGFYGWMTGKEYLSFFAKMYGMDNALRNKRVDELLERVSLHDKMKVPIKQYSRGMKQRLGLAKTIIHQPKLIILDEPTLGLDPQGQKDIQQLILELNRQMNVTIFITSHLLKEIDEMCNRVAIVKKGQLLEEGLVSDLKARYLVSEGKSGSVEDIFLAMTST
jgi:ABC-type multidrug transport system ATPase subunit